jgi:hypothetical protein
MVGALAGIVFGVLFWWLYLTEKGATIAEGLRGNVEDGIGTLDGLVNLGGIVGAVVGLLHGGTKMPNRTYPNNENAN